MKLYDILYKMMWYERYKIKCKHTIRNRIIRYKTI